MNAATCLFMFATLLISGRILAKEEPISKMNHDEKKHVLTLVEQNTERSKPDNN